VLPTCRELVRGMNYGMRRFWRQFKEVNDRKIPVTAWAMNANGMSNTYPPRRIRKHSKGAHGFEFMGHGFVQGPMHTARTTRPTQSIARSRRSRNLPAKRRDMGKARA